MAESVDVVNHPSHYADGWSNGAEVIDITENLNFNRGNAVKYIARAGAKDPDKLLEDLRKARWYITREITRLAGPFDVVDDEDINPVLLDEPLEYVEAEPEPRVWWSIIEGRLQYLGDDWQLDGGYGSSFNDGLAPFTEVIA